MKSHLFAMFVWNFTTTRLSIAEILLLLIKTRSKIAVGNIADNNACIMLTYARPPILMSAHCASAFTKFLHKQKNGSLINREDRMLIKILHQEKGSKKLLAEFPNKVFEMIPTVFTALENCVFSVSSKRYITTEETQFIEILHTVPKWVLDYAV